MILLTGEYMLDIYPMLVVQSRLNVHRTTQSCSVLQKMTTTKMLISFILHTIVVDAVLFVQNQMNYHTRQ